MMNRGDDMGMGDADTTLNAVNMAEDRPRSAAESQIAVPSLNIFLGSTPSFSALEVMRQLIHLPDLDRRRVALMFLDIDSPPSEVLQFRQEHPGLLKEFDLRISVAHGVLFAGMMADRIFFAGAQLPDFQLEVLGGGAFLVLVFAGPLAVFVPLMARVRRNGLREYGALGQTYVRDFRAKWMAGAAAEEPLVGSGDIQSLADLGNSFATAEQMRFAPIRPRAVVAFLAAFLAPMLPLALLMMPAEKLLERLMALVF